MGVQGPLTTPSYTAQKMKKSLLENFNFCSVLQKETFFLFKKVPASIIKDRMSLNPSNLEFFNRSIF